MTPASSVSHALLQRVSRSFFLSLRMLPKPVRPTISLAYLLARASDSVADVASAPGDLRIRLLSRLPGFWPPEPIPELECPAGADRDLLAAMPSLLEMLRSSPDREEIEGVWLTIRKGQAFDLERFPAASPLALEETRQYAGLVAGCVGEFWTDVCFKHIPNYSRESPETMRRLGFSFGCGLQWVNILRDRHADARAARGYVAPEDFSAGLAIARGHLADGARYSAAVRPRRLRAACRLPLLLGIRTLDLIEASPANPCVKVSRWFVWRSLALASLR
ncbi:MAG: squalene/phytoene synthase family protein [Verrucomicrobiae bacterium]